MTTRTITSRPWRLAAVAWLLWLTALVIWLSLTSGPLLREQLTVLQFWSLEACVLLAAVAGAVVLWRLLRYLGRTDAAVLGFLAVASGLIIAGAARTNRIYYDEQIYQNVAQNLAASRRAQMCNDGAIEDGRLRCFRGEYNKQPYAYPHLLGMGYRVAGVRAGLAFVVNAAAMILSVSLLYLLVVVLFDDRVAAFFAAWLLALTPEQIIWSASAAVEPTASLACIGAVLAAACFVRFRSTVSLAGMAIALAYAVQFRPESLLIVAVVIALVWQRAREELIDPRLWWTGLLFLVLVTVHVGHMTAVSNEGWGASQERLSLRYVMGNLRVNGWFYLNDSRFPGSYALLAVLGLSGRRMPAGRAAVLLWFLSFFGITLLFYAGSYNFGGDVRYSLATYPALSIFAGLGLARVAAWIERAASRVATRFALAVVVALQFLWFLPLVRTIDDGAWAARADVGFARSLVPQLPPHSYVLTHNPGMFQLWGVNAGQTSLAAGSPAFLDDLVKRYTGGVYLHWNFWCNVQDPLQRGFCTTVLGLAPAALVREHQELNQYFALYRLMPASTP